MRFAFALHEQKCRLLSFNPRAEHHGEETVPAADLKIEVALANDELAMFHPALKSLLYHYDSQIAGDLVDVAKKDEDKNYSPHLRMQKLVTPLKWDDAITGATVRIHYGATGRDIVLTTADVNNFTIDPQQGGTVMVGFRVQAKPDEKQSGKLCTMVQTDIELSIEPPEAMAEAA